MIKTIYSEYIEDVISFIKVKHNKESIEILDEEEKDIFEILNILSNIDILNENRVFIIRNPNKFFKEIDNIESQDDIYVYTSKNIKNVSKEIIKEENSVNYIQAIFEKNNIVIGKNTIKDIIDIIGENKLILQNEIQKCIYYIYPQKEIKNIEEIKNILTENNNSIIWSLTNAIVTNNKNLIIKEFSELILQNEDLYMISSMVLRQIYIIILIYIYKNENDKEIVSILKKDPFKINISEYGVLKIKQNIHKFSENKLRETYHRIIKLITLANSGKIDMNLSLLILFLTI